MLSMDRGMPFPSEYLRLAWGEDWLHSEWTEGCNRHQHQNQVPWFFSNQAVRPNEYQMGMWVLDSVLAGLGRRGRTPCK